MEKVILALDQGTTSSRAILFSRDGRPLGQAQQEFEQILPGEGLVEHDPEAIWSSQIATARQVLAETQTEADRIAAIGIANQRETVVLWERESGRPVGNAIVWQSRVSAPVCDELRERKLADLFRDKTGLVLDPYFSGTKVKYLLDRKEGLRDRARRGEVLFGTVDSWLIWRLTEGRCHVTDVSNACRTLFYNIHTLDWDDELLEVLDVPRAMLPEVRGSSEVVGETASHWFGRAVPIAGIAGDQQAATFGQACFEPGSAKNTYGTGCFTLINTGSEPVASKNNLLTTIGWSIDGKVTYCLEGAVFIAGAVVQWLRDGLGLIESSSEVERLAATVEDSGGVFLVPAFVGLGAPHWDAYARGAILGITRATKAGHIARAAVESMAYQVRDLIDAMQKDAAEPITVLKVDGGASVNDMLMQFQADLLGIEVQRPTVSETTALGAAYLAGLAVGYWRDLDDLARHWSLEQRFLPELSEAEAARRHQRWLKAISRSLDWAEGSQ